MAIEIVWRASAGLTVMMALTTLLAGVLPAAIAYVGQLIVDAVVMAIQTVPEVRDAATDQAIFYVLCEAGLVVLITAIQRINTVCQSILRVLLGNEINVVRAKRLWPRGLRRDHPTEADARAVADLARREAAGFGIEVEILPQRDAAPSSS